MPSDLTQLADGVGKLLEVAPDLYDDAVKPTATETGKLVGRVPRAINAVFSGLDRWILKKEYSVEETKKLLEEKLSNVNPDKIVAPEPYVAIPAIQAISYSMDSKELRDMYANLLAKSMNSDTKNFVHPGYVELIKQLSPNDAKYFKHLCSLNVRPMLDIQLSLKDSMTITIAKDVNLFSNGFTDNQALTIDNLSRLMLISIPFGTWYGDNSIYTDLLDISKNEYPFENFKHLSPDALKMKYAKSRIDITSMGKEFYKICVQ